MDTATRAVAIVGVGAILPDALNASAFWQNVINKRYSIADVPPERWSPADYFDPDPKAPDKSYTKIGGWVRGYEFDWRRFRIPPRVADAMDPGQQWALSVAAEALADYGHPQRPLPTERTAVVLGTAMGGELHYITNQRISFPEYAHALEAVPEFAGLPASTQQAIMQKWRGVIGDTFPPITEDSMPGELPNIVSGRVANVLNLRGPNFITDAACASSLAALEAAIEMLIEHKVDAAVTGGVDRNMGASTFVKFCKIGALSATGTRPFGDGADGFVMGEGAAAFLLKRLEDAERDGDRIYAVIRGVGGSSDGKGKGITAPNPVGQQLAIERGWENAGLDPATATLVEAHGTSTRVGDVVEVESLTKMFGGAPRHGIGLGSVKSNIGHLKAGAGAAGLLKATLALHHKVLPPTLNANPANPNIDFANSPFSLVHDAQSWEVRTGAPRRSGVSAYGFGGTNFHVVLEEHVPGMLKPERKSFAAVDVQSNGGQRARIESAPAAASTAPLPAPVRGILALGAADAAGLAQKLNEALNKAEAGWTPPVAVPESAILQAAERLVIDFEDNAQLLRRLQKAQQVMGKNNAQAWKAMEAQGIFRGSGAAPGKVAFMFPGQGSQYVNMGRELAAISPAVAEVFAEADRVMEPILGKPLTDYIFVDTDDKTAVNRAQMSLIQTEITQPAMLTLDIAILKLLETYGFRPEMVVGHSLGEYAALVAAGVMPFADALEAAAARGDEMSKVEVADNGKMAAILAPYEEIEATLNEVSGYVVPANINSSSQCVIGGSSAGVDEAVALFQEKGFRAIPLPVSHAFHTSIVAPASKPLRQVLDRLNISPPRLPLVANVTGEFYPDRVDAIKDILEKQIASPVQWVKGLQTLYDAGVRTFIEAGPKRALWGFARDIFKDNPDVTPVLTNHPKKGDLPTFNLALCALYAAGYGAVMDGKIEVSERIGLEEDEMMIETKTSSTNGTPASMEAMAQMLAQMVQQAAGAQAPAATPQLQQYDRHTSPTGSVVISGTGLGLPGAEKSVMDPDNALRILRGEQFVDLIPERFRKKILAKRITRLVKGPDGSGRFETITDPDDVIKLAGRPGYFDLHEEYGVPQKLIEALDSTTQLAMAAGLDALREAGIPLVQTYRRTTTDKFLPDRWLLPESLRDETGVIFASAFPGGDRFADEFQRYYTFQNRLEQLQMLQDLRAYTRDSETLRELDRRINTLREALEQEPYTFDRRFLFRILSMGHSQFAEYIGARGPNTQVNAACASTAQGIAIAEDWIRNGRCRRVIVIGADNVTGDSLMEWVGAGFLAVGAAATDDRVDEAALPFDRRRHGTLMGMGACALVVESEDAVRERGMRGIVELLASETNNSAFHGTRLDVSHIAQVMNSLVTSAERRFGLSRHVMAPQTVFMSHETYTPARGGSAAAEVEALRHTFGDAAREIIVANTKGFTGHPMGVGVEDVIAVKILEYSIVPPVPNFREVDPSLGPLNLSRGGRYPVQYALHLAAGFGSQISLTLTRRIPGALDRIDSKPRYQRWLDEISGHNQAQTYVEKRVLRIEAQGVPQRTPVASPWQPGTGPVLRALVGQGDGAAPPPARMAAPPPPPVTRSVPQPAAAPPPKPQPAPEPAPTPVAVPPAPAVAEPATAVPPATPAQPAIDEVSGKVLAIVAEQTGYPKDMLDLDLDLEADLGIDTVKQAETFAAIRDEFDIPRRDDMQLRDYPTLEKVIGFVHEMRPDLTPAVAETAAPPISPVPSPTPSLITDDRLPATDDHPPATDPVTGKVLAIVADQTGYPEDMLDLDLDLEADLGIDTVKQAETFAAIRDEFDIPRRDDLQLRDYPTLEKVIGFVHEMRPDLIPAAAEPAATPAPAPVTDDRLPATDDRPPVPDDQPVTTDPVLAKVLAIVAEQTGYPEDMLELDLDMEADLGIDTVKQAETFAAIRAEFDIPRRDDLQLRDYPTLEKVIGFVHEMRPDLKADGVTGAQRAATTAPATPAATPVPTKEVAAMPIENADRMPRRVPVPVVRPALNLCKPTGVTLNDESRVIVALDQGGVGKSLVSRLEKLGVTVLPIANPLSGDELEAQVQAWLAEGPIQGVYWLVALDAEPVLTELDLDAWRELNRLRVKNLYTTTRALSDAVSQPGTFLVSATRLGGMHGYGAEGATAPLGGAVVGFTKAYKRERADVLVKAVDFPVSRKTAAFADALIAETEWDPGVVEVGYHDGQRFGVGLVERPLAAAEPALTLDQQSVIVVTGAAGGITSAIVADLAAASGSIFYLLDLVEAPARDDVQIALFRTNKDGLKQELIAAAKAAGERPTPVLIEKRLMAVERSEAALAAIEAVETAGGTAYYHSVNLLDGPAVTAVVDEIRARHGKIDALIHAGGLEISKPLPKKEANEFNLVFDVKADGFFSLLRAAADMPIGATVAFSSVAGRFGNSGQTDYSAANDLLCKLSSSLRRWRPETRGIVIDWSAWGEIGMATRGSIPKIMEMAGIEMLPPDVGIPTVRRELLYGGGELVTGGALGILTEEWDATGGLDLAKANAWLQENYADLLMVGEIKGAKLYGGFEVETELDPQVQPFLFDHAPDEGTPWLPGVMATEALAELATVLVPGYAVTAVANEEMSGAFKFFRNEPRTLYLTAFAEPGAGDGLIVHATLRSVTQPAREGLPTREQQHFAADVHLQPQPPDETPIEFTPPAADALPLTNETIYQSFFHGPAYQVIEQAGMADNQALGLIPIALPPNSDPESARTLMAPRLVEACFQLAALWTQEVKKAMGFPLGIGAVTVYRQAEAAADRRLYAVVTTPDDGETFNGKVIDEAGNVYVDLCGYRTVARPLS